MGDLPIDPLSASQESEAYEPSQDVLMAIEFLDTGIRHFQKLKKDISRNAVSILLAINDKPGITVNELIERIGKISQASCSRNINWLSDRDRHGAPGQGLVEARRNPTNTRQHAMYLTAKGEAFMTELGEALEALPLADNARHPTSTPHT